MLSPMTFLGIAKALSPAVQPAVARPPAGANRPVENEPRETPLVQSARILGTPPLGVTPPPPSGTRPPATVAPGQQQTAPPRNLPRGSLLDLSV